MIPFIRIEHNCKMFDKNVSKLKLMEYKKIVFQMNRTHLFHPTERQLQMTSKCNSIRVAAPEPTFLRLWFVPATMVAVHYPRAYEHQADCRPWKSNRLHYSPTNRAGSMVGHSAFEALAPLHSYNCSIRNTKAGCLGHSLRGRRAYSKLLAVI